jgi:hypothetical protein
MLLKNAREEKITFGTTYIVTTESDLAVSGENGPFTEPAFRVLIWYYFF